MTNVCRIGLAFNLTVSAVLLGVSAFYACGPQLFSYALLATMSTAFALYRLAGPRLVRLRFRALRRVVSARRAGSRLLALVAASAAASAPYARRFAVPAVATGMFLAFGVDVFAGDGPWVEAANAVCKAFVGPIGKGLALVAFVVGGLMFAFGEGGSKSALAGLIFGAGMVLSAPAFLEWILGKNTVCGS